MEITNKKIQIVEAVTETNSASKSSRITGQVLEIGNAVFERIEGFQDDAVFYENIEIEKNKGAFWRPMLYVNKGIIILDNVFNSRAKSIIIRQFNIV